MKHPLVLAILDGWGEASQGPHNVISVTPTPFWDSLRKTYPYTLLMASGHAVGLPKNQAGNSEAGHMNLGAGRIVEQDSLKISRSISNGTFFYNSALQGAIKHVRQLHSKLHLIGIISGNQSPHINPDHLLALLTLAKKSQIKKVYLHFFTDGRDSFYYNGKKYIDLLLREHTSMIEISTIMGRLYLDRKKNWIRTKDAYEAMVKGKGLSFSDPILAVEKAYARGQTDEFISPSVIVDKRGKAKGLIGDNDAVIFYNLRSDRARQLTKVFVQQNFEKKNPNSFKRAKVIKSLYFVAMTDFGPDLAGLVTAYTSQKIEHTLPFCLGHTRQLYIAESEKYAHITYFFNGGYDHPVAGETRKIVHSALVDSYARTPAMCTPDITDIIIKNLPRYNFIAANFASPDMIGHTGDMRAASKAVTIIDHHLLKLARAVDSHAGILMVTADHGNVEELIDHDTHKVNTQHSTNPVPFIIYGKKFKGKKLKKSSHNKLADVAPTILSVLNVKQPSLMTGKNLL